MIRIKLWMGCLEVVVRADQETDHRTLGYIIMSPFLTKGTGVVTLLWMQ